MFKVQYMVREWSRQGSQVRSRHVARGALQSQDYSVAKQIKASLDGIAFDNAEHGLESRIIAQIRTGSGVANVELECIDFIRQQLAELEEQMTLPSKVPHATAAE